MFDLYREHILDHYKNPRNFGRMKNPDLEGFETNPLCGDSIGIQLKFDKNKAVQEIKFYGEGCAISRASASMLTEVLKGKRLRVLSKIENEDIIQMLGRQISPARLKCAILPLESLKKAVVSKKANRNKKYL